MTLLRDSDTQLVLLPLDPEPRVSAPILRPIHYLGSKLRVLDSIRDAIDIVDPRMDPVCDLFAGSGTVANALSPSRAVVAVDIQQYSRAICSALLTPSVPDGALIDQVFSRMRCSTQSKALIYATAPMIDYEARCLALAAANDPDPLCDLLEQGSIFAFEQSQSDVEGAELRMALAETRRRLTDTGLHASHQALAIRYFGGIYFSYLQAAQIDSILDALSEVPHRHRDTFLAALLSTASDVVNTVGKQFAQPIRPRTAAGVPKTHLIRQIERDRSMDVASIYELWLGRYNAVPQPRHEHRIICADYRMALANLGSDVGVVYADPPYTRDHYSRYYHVLETLCLRDNPLVSTVKARGTTRMSRGMYRTARHQSPFCIASQAGGAFSELFAGVRSLGVPLVLSYSPYTKGNGSRPRVMTLDEITALAAAVFRRVDVVAPTSIAHNKLNTAERNVAVAHAAEVLVICEP